MLESHSTLALKFSGRKKAELVYLEIKKARTGITHSK